MRFTGCVLLLFVLKSFHLVSIGQGAALSTPGSHDRAERTARDYPGLNPSWYTREDLRVLQSYHIGSSCTLTDGHSSFCMAITSCPTAARDERRGVRPVRCGEQDWVVCCPDAARGSSPKSSNKFVSLPVVAMERLPGRFTTVTPRVDPGRVMGRRAQQECRGYMSRVKSGLSHYIKGGTEVELGQFPHMALIGYKYNGNSNTFGQTLNGRKVSWRCGGTLVSDKFVLTAAHCVASLGDDAPKVVRVGELDWASDTDGATPQDFMIKRIILQPEYRSPQSYHDIALLELERPVVFTTAVQPACLPRPDDQDLTGRTLMLTGWGDLEFMMDSVTSHLMKAPAMTVPLTECRRSYSDESDLMKLPRGLSSRGHLCAQDRHGAADACQGDSGGPLQESISGSPLYRVVGVVSVGKSCSGVAPSLYTKVADYVDWIEGVVWPTIEPRSIY